MTICYLYLLPQPRNTLSSYYVILLCNNVLTHPPGLGLVLECLLGVLGGGLHVIHGVLHMVLDTVYHLPLHTSQVIERSKYEVNMK